MKTIEAGRLGPDRSSHDLGNLLAEGQTIEHRFRISNHSDHPMRIIRAAARVPCCSSIGPLPETVPARGSVDVPTSLKVGNSPGFKRVEFTVWTDSPERPSWHLELVANLLAKGDIGPADEADRSRLAAGRLGRWVWKATTRRRADRGRAAPVEVAVAAPLQAAFLGPNLEQPLPDGLIEIRRDVEITLPASQSAGHHRAELVIGCEDGTSLRDSLHWSVEDAIRVAPAGLVLSRTGGVQQKAFLLRSSGPPFRVTGVVNPLSNHPGAPDADRSDHSHRVALELDPTRAADRSTVNLVIKTDLPEQPEVSISILILDHESVGTR